MSLHKTNWVLRQLSTLGVDALRSKMQNGKYFGPLVSKRRAAMIRKKSIIDGTFGTFVPFQGGWDPAWDVPRKMYMLKPLKGHASDRSRPERALKIDNAMKGMPDRLKKYKQEAADRKPKKDIFFQMKRVLALAKKHKGGSQQPTK